MIERVVEEISFHAPERAGESYTVDKEVCAMLFNLKKTHCQSLLYPPNLVT